MTRAARSAAPLLVLGLVASARPAAAQAWVPRSGQGSVTLVGQMIDHIGRLLDDGTRIECCGTTNVAVVVGIDYGITERWAISAGLPFVFAKYRGEAPAGGAAFLPYPDADACHCLHAAFQDMQLSTRYNVVRLRRAFWLTPSASYRFPTHPYEYVGEAVVGFGLQELSLGIEAGERLDFVVPGVALEGDYAYTVAERAVGVSHNRSNAHLDGSYTFSNGLAGHLILSGQRTHGGLRFPFDVEPFPERLTEFHRLLRDDYFQLGGGISFPWREWEFEVSALRTVSGTNTHDVHVYTVSAGRSFRLRRPQ